MGDARSGDDHIAGAGIVKDSVHEKAASALQREGDLNVLMPMQLMPSAGAYKCMTVRITDRYFVMQPGCGCAPADPVP